jgi:hypothetical protein
VRDLEFFTQRQFGVVTAQQSIACGYTARDIEELRVKEAWTWLRSGIYLPGRAPDRAADPYARHAVDIAAALLALRPKDMIVSHVSAAVLWDLPWVETPDLSVVTLTRPRGRGPTRMYPGMRIRPAPLPVDHVATAPNGMPVTSVARTLVDLARALPRRDVLVMADEALHTGLVRQQEIDRTLLDCAGWPGIRAAGRNLALADERIESVAESVARSIMLDLGFSVPEPQVRIWDRTGTCVARADFYFAEWRLIVAVDGKQKYLDRPEAAWAEKLQQDVLHELGYEVVRLTWADLKAGHEVVREKVEAGIRRAQARGLHRNPGT